MFLDPLSASSREKIISEIKRLEPWFHNIEIAEGLSTNSKSKYPSGLWNLTESFIPEKLEHKTCLDIGCESGFFSFKLRERGAVKVIGIDERKSAIDQGTFIKEIFGYPNITFRQMSVYEVDKLGLKFDYVLCLASLYHFRYPLLALDKIRTVAKGKLVLQTLISKTNEDVEVTIPPPIEDTALRSEEFYDNRYPRFHFIERKMDGDDTNWWLPNYEGLLAILRAAGFKIERTFSTQDSRSIFAVCV